MSDGQATGGLRSTHAFIIPMTTHILLAPRQHDSSISGLVVEYIVAIDVTRVRFPADACFQHKVMLFDAATHQTSRPHAPTPKFNVGSLIWGPPLCGRKIASQH